MNDECCSYVVNMNNKYKYAVYDCLRMMTQCDSGLFRLKIKKRGVCNDVDRRILEKISADYGKRINYNFSLIYHMKLLFISRNIAFWDDKKKIVGRLRRSMLKMYGCMNENIVLKIKYDDSVCFDTVSKILRLFVDRIPCDDYVKDCLFRNSRIIHQSRKSVSDLLVNHIAFAKSYRRNECPKCM